MTIHSNQDPLQQALFKAAKVGHIKLMRELIIAGADPFISDEKGHSAISYATKSDPIKTGSLLLELSDTFKKGGEDE
jgi:ankyrin repeat protein